MYCPPHRGTHSEGSPLGGGRRTSHRDHSHWTQKHISHTSAARGGAEAGLGSRSSVAASLGGDRPCFHKTSLLSRHTCRQQEGAHPTRGKPPSACGSPLPQVRLGTGIGRADSLGKHKVPHQLSTSPRPAQASSEQGCMLLSALLSPQLFQRDYVCGWVEGGSRGPSSPTGPKASQGQSQGRTQGSRPSTNPTPESLPHIA